MRAFWHFGCIDLFFSEAMRKEVEGGMRRGLGFVVVGIFVVVSCVVGIKLADAVIMVSTQQTWYDAEADKRTIRTYNLYPYTGFHLQPDYHHVGPMPWAEFYDSFNYQSGDHGFFVDFDLENPPEKKPNEFRIIWTGGSGAQGWGAQTNDHMLYRVLERQLNERLADKDIFVRVINLAMGGSISYQNFIALNRWGHKLQPDLIASYSGANDITVYEGNRSNIYNNNFLDLRVLMATSYYSESPAWLKQVAEWFPGLIKRTALGAIVRYYAAQSNMDGAREIERAAYNGSFGFSDLPTKYAHPIKESVILQRISIPEYVHALQSIRRDFPNIPIVIARQVIDWRRVSQSLPMEGDYETFWRSSVEQIEGYGDGPWYFVDLQNYWIEKGYFGPQYRPGFVHLDNEKVLLAAERLVPVLEKAVLSAINH